MKAGLLVLILGLSASGAHAGIQPTERMKCADVIRQVKTHQRYYKTTADGVLPIYSVSPIPGAGETYRCGGREQVWHHIVKTADQTRCLVGYDCNKI